MANLMDREESTLEVEKAVVEVIRDTGYTPIAQRRIPAWRHAKNQIWKGVCFAAVCLGVFMLLLVLWGAMKDGFGKVSLEFLTKQLSTRAARTGIGSALWGSLWVLGLTLAISVPIGIAAAIYLEEIAKKTKLIQLIQTNIANLAGVPSVIFGLLGLMLFVRGMGLGPTIIAAALTMSLLVMPTVILTTQEGLRTVPKALRDASLAMGATRWQSLLRITIPCALPPIFTGMILAASRAIGETAPLLVVGAAASLTSSPSGIRDNFTVIPIQIYSWSSQPGAEWRPVTSAAIIVLLVTLILLNSIAIFLRQRTKRI